VQQTSVERHGAVAVQVAPPAAVVSPGMQTGFEIVDGHCFVGSCVVVGPAVVGGLVTS
jgi:hypothetical protein